MNIYTHTSVQMDFKYIKFQNQFLVTATASSVWRHIQNPSAQEEVVGGVLSSRPAQVTYPDSTLKQKGLVRLLRVKAILSLQKTQNTCLVAHGSL